MRKGIGIAIAAAALLWSAAMAEARPAPGSACESARARAAKTAKDEWYMLKVGNLGAVVTNYGKIGDASTPRQSSMEWPLGSQNDYLYEGRLWFGAKVGGAIQVSTGDDLEWGTSATATGDTLLKITGPDAVGDFDTYCIYTDQVPNNQHPIGIKVYQRTSTWTISYLDDNILYDMTFENISGSDLTGVYIGTAMDGDVSSLEGSENYIDDLTFWTRYTAGGQMRFLSYEYDSDNPEIPGDDTGGPAGQTKGYLGTSPLLVQDATGTDVLPSLIQNLTLTHYWWDWNHDPGSDDLKYSYMASRTQLSTPPSPFDYRYMQSYGPFDMPAGSRIRIMFVIGVGEGLAGLKDNINAVHDLYEANKQAVGKWIASGPPPAPGVSAIPGDGQVTIKWSSAGESHVDPVTGVTDFAGYRVWKSPTGVEGTWTLIADFDKLDDFGLNSGLPSKDAQGNYQYVDNQVHNGFAYWYAVTVYDRGDLEQVGSLESSQNSNKIQVYPGPVGTNAGDNIYVYPNPYRFQATWDPQPGPQQPAGNRIRFNNIPGRCTIRIYTMSGDLVATLEHTDGTGYHDWEFLSDRGQPQKIVAGIYLYSVRGEGVDYVDKFVVLR